MDQRDGILAGYFDLKKSKNGKLYFVMNFGFIVYWFWIDTEKLKVTIEAKKNERDNNNQSKGGFGNGQQQQQQPGFGQSGGGFAGPATGQHEDDEIPF